VERRLSLVDPDSLVSASYGYFEQSTPWIVSNDGALAGVSKLADNSIDCVVSNPPCYWRRDYGVEGQTGREETLTEHVEKISAVYLKYVARIGNIERCRSILYSGRDAIMNARYTGRVNPDQSRSCCFFIVHSHKLRDDLRPRGKRAKILNSHFDNRKRRLERHPRGRTTRDTGLNNRNRSRQGRSRRTDIGHANGE